MITNRNPRTPIGFKLFAKVRRLQIDGKTNVEIQAETDLCKSSINSIRRAETWQAWVKRKERKMNAKRLRKRAADIAGEVQAEETIPAVSALDGELAKIKSKQATLERALRTIKSDQIKLGGDAKTLSNSIEDFFETELPALMSRLENLETFHANARASKKMSRQLDKGAKEVARKNWREM